ncbi:hypothetical protein D6201_07385 [Aurantiacibacter aquimixticola]|uniref:Spore coat protein U domain-containing protein n=1 Tax=Aurantiacibacter aquimixticola TaxID=1958945 RepID=A0A419RTT5_9SPHN|nr:hypothetical protein D6201_07385 [Aurantiacibacter aquimixticola]
MPLSWGIGSGLTSSSILVQLISPDGQVVDQLNLAIDINVLPSVALRIVGATGQGRVARVDLGAIENDRINRSQPLGVRVWSTSPYQVTYRSANRGALVQADLPDRIEYELRAAGAVVDLTGNRPSTVGQRTSSLGDLHSLEVVVPPFEAQAGKYGDRVTITVTAS